MLHTYRNLIFDTVKYNYFYVFIIKGVTNIKFLNAFINSVYN